MRKTTLVGAVACAAVLVGSNVGVAQAAGQVERGPDHANSECSFSGLNDEPDAEFPDGGRTQNYGQFLRFKVVPPGYNAGGRAVPGAACNGHLSGMKTGA